LAKRDNNLLKLPDDFEGNMRALLATPPAPHDTTGSRKAAPKPPVKPKKRKAAKRIIPPAQRTATGSYAYEIAPVTSKWKAAKKKR
jgi:hypothetical protein